MRASPESLRRTRSKTGCAARRPPSSRWLTRGARRVRLPLAPSALPKRTKRRTTTFSPVLAASSARPSIVLPPCFSPLMAAGGAARSSSHFFRRPRRSAPADVLGLALGLLARTRAAPRRSSSGTSLDRYGGRRRPRCRGPARELDGTRRPRHEVGLAVHLHEHADLAVGVHVAGPRPRRRAARRAWRPWPALHAQCGCTRWPCPRRRRLRGRRLQSIIPGARALAEAFTASAEIGASSSLTPAVGIEGALGAARAPVASGPRPAPGGGARRRPPPRLAACLLLGLPLGALSRAALAPRPRGACSSPRGEPLLLGAGALDLLAHHAGDRLDHPAGADRVVVPGIT